MDRYEYKKAQCSAMRCGKSLFTMVCTASLLLLLVAAASADPEPFIICETAAVGNSSHGQPIYLPVHVMNSTDSFARMSIPQIIWQYVKSCRTIGVKAEVCHARIEHLNINLNMTRLQVQRPYGATAVFTVPIKTTVYCNFIDDLASGELPALD